MPTKQKSASKSSSPQPSLWKSSIDVWVFLLLTLLAGGISYVLHLFAMNYDQPNPLTTASSLCVIVAGSAMIAAAFGLVHLGFHQPATVVWASAAGLALLICLTGFFLEKTRLGPGLIFGLSLLILCAIGLGLGRATDRYRKQFPDSFKFLNSWD